MKRTPLKRTVGLKRKPLNKISKKQKARNRELAKIKPPEDGLCQECKRPPDWRGLSRHHLLFRSHGGKDTADNLKWLCGICHDKMHGIIDK